MFMAATAMATTVSTLAAAAWVRADSRVAAASAVTCACECPPSETRAEARTEAPPPPPPEAERHAVPPATVHGALDKDVVRRVVRAHIDEVRGCYDAALREDAKAAGRVELSLHIDADGKVAHAEAHASTLPAEVGACVAESAAAWKFPEPGDGQSVAVLYPFVMEPG
jgi:hypothetical protein